MKKILIATSALVAVAFTGQAQASEPIKLSVGGYMNQWAGFADQEVGDRNNAFQSDTEIHFKGSTTLDNGIEVGAVVELEGETSGDQIDEQYLFVNGGFGRIEMGKNDSAADSMQLVAPAVGPVGINDGDLDIWVDSYLIDTTIPTGDQNRVTYYTPSFGGFRAGVSFADDSNRNGANGYNNQDGSGDNIVSGGLEYEADLNGISLGVSAIGENWGEGNLVGGGLNVGFGNFTVGGSYSHTDDDYGFSEGDSDPDDTDQFDIGVSYEMDAAAVSLTYGYAEYGNGSRGDGTGEISTADLGLAYTLGAGVEWKSSIFWFDDEVDGAEDNDGYGVVTGFALTF
ncbi:porin [Thalassospira lucentensis]|uniref:porin n=1 Tax=Thalassospira lucentensis TaxID=168935 RepID=UPI002943905E|nr:porin [Thalassospira lucentensis]UKV14469.1 porin [Thalassospiraceae bacterium SW-3-3]WOI12431.1 porin [Thalassospira lucentensis]